MNNQITLKFDGTIIGGGAVSIRTLAHTLPHLQRAIDKLVLLEKQGDIGKNATLPNKFYADADLYLSSIEKGSIKLPLRGIVGLETVKKFIAYLDAPFQEASGAIVGEGDNLADGVLSIRLQLENQLVKPITHAKLVEIARNNAISYARAAFLSDINAMLSPLRSRSAAGSTITISTMVPGATASYAFDPSISKEFGRIIGRRTLGHPTVYDGFLLGIEEKKTGDFEYAGTFEINKGPEFKLLVRNSADAAALNPFNLRGGRFRFVGCPLTKLGTFDPLKGDVAFVKLI